MDVRPARDEDGEAIRLIYNSEVLGSTVTFDLVPRTPEDQAAWMSEHRGVYPVIVATDGRDVLGFASLSPYRPRPAYSPTAEDSIYVAPSSRGQGVGRTLLTELLGFGAGHGFHSVIARIVGDHEASIALHRGCGFELIGIEREVGRKFGRWLDVALMQRML